MHYVAVALSGVREDHTRAHHTRATTECIRGVAMTESCSDRSGDAQARHVYFRSLYACSGLKQISVVPLTTLASLSFQYVLFEVTLETSA